jgi:hypothetical protein
MRRGWLRRNRPKTLWRHQRSSCFQGHRGRRGHRPPHLTACSERGLQAAQRMSQSPPPHFFGEVSERRPWASKMRRSPGCFCRALLINLLRVAHIAAFVPPLRSTAADARACRRLFKPSSPDLFSTASNSSFLAWSSSRRNRFLATFLYQLPFGRGRLSADYRERDRWGMGTGRSWALPERPLPNRQRAREGTRQQPRPSFPVEMDLRDGLAVATQPTLALIRAEERKNGR